MTPASYFLFFLPSWIYRTQIWYCINTKLTIELYCSKLNLIEAGCNHSHVSNPSSTNFILTNFRLNWIVPGIPTDFTYNSYLDIIYVFIMIIFMLTLFLYLLHPFVSQKWNTKFSIGVDIQYSFNNVSAEIILQWIKTPCDCFYCLILVKTKNFLTMNVQLISNVLNHEWQFIFFP